MICPNCESTTHARCCAYCGHIMRKRKDNGKDFCSVLCAAGQDDADRNSAESETDCPTVSP